MMRSLIVVVLQSAVQMDTTESHSTSNATMSVCLTPRQRKLCVEIRNTTKDMWHLSQFTTTTCGMFS
jgi:hypothetical protein